MQAFYGLFKLEPIEADDLQFDLTFPDDNNDDKITVTDQRELLARFDNLDHSGVYAILGKNCCITADTTHFVLYQNGQGMIIEGKKKGGSIAMNWR